MSIFRNDERVRTEVRLVPPLSNGSFAAANRCEMTGCGTSVARLRGLEEPGLSPARISIAINPSGSGAPLRPARRASTAPVRSASV